MAAPQHVAITDLTDEEFEHRTLEAIRREFGLGGLARFIMTYRSGKGDYTAERQQRQDPMTPEEIERELTAMAALTTHRADDVIS